MIVQGFETQVDLGHHSDLHDLRLDLPKAGLQASPTGTLRDQDPGRTHERVDDVADPQRELLDPPAHAGADDGLVQLHLGLSQRGFGAGLFGREEGGDPRLGRSALRPWRQRSRPCAPSTPTSSFSISRRATLPGLRLFSSCLVSSSSTACW